MSQAGTKENGSHRISGWSRLAYLLKRRFSRARLVRLGVGVSGSVAALLFVVWLGELGAYDLTYALAIIPGLLKGFEITLQLVGTVIPVGFAVGFLVGWARTSRSAFLRGFGAIYVDFFRSLPPIVLIAFAFLIGLVTLHNFIYNPYLVQTIVLWLGVFALGLHTAAYQAEIVRAGILSVATGQMEAADAIGLSRSRSMFLVVLPQAFRVSLPALGNEFSSVIKDTSLLSAIGWLDLSGIGLVEVYAGIKVTLFAPLVVWIEIAILYFVVTFAVTTIVRSIEETFKVPGLQAAQL